MSPVQLLVQKSEDERSELVNLCLVIRRLSEARLARERPTMNACPDRKPGHVGTSSSNEADVGSLALLPPGTTAGVEAAGFDLTLANVDGTIVALLGPCLRCGSPLAGAALSHDVLTCLHCGWQYDLERGAVVGLPALRLHRYEVRVEGGRMFVPAELFDDAPRTT